MTTARTNINGQTRKTLASQLDRLDGILDGLDSALTGAVQEAVEQAVKQAVQAVLTEVLTNRQLQQELQQAAESAQPPDEPRGKQSMTNRIWQATTQGVRRTVRTVKQFSRGVGMAAVGRRRRGCRCRLCRSREDRVDGQDCLPTRKTAGSRSDLVPDELLAFVCFWSWIAEGGDVRSAWPVILPYSPADAVQERVSPRGYPP